ncbi:MAG: hypothetical protein HZA64_07010 [Rhodocyclales bacterium]|nr:hypothetical protein [Rhodocyclales bacterium]
MSEAKIPAALPKWIPWGGQYVYEAVYINGGFSAPRVAKATDTLFHAAELESWWQSLAGLRIPPDGWSFLIGAIVMMVECSPAAGKRATRDAPDDKVAIRERQKVGTKLMGQAAKKARELAELLDQIEENGGEVPDESYSGLALLEAAIASDGMARACCNDPFDAFRRELSSYAESHFPHPTLIVDALASALEAFPGDGEIFASDPWLSSAQSSWKDYVRVVTERLTECKRMYGDAPAFTDAEWTVLLQQLIDSSLTRQTVTKGLKEL